MKKYNNPDINIEIVDINSILEDSPVLGDGGYGDWGDGAIEDF